MNTQLKPCPFCGGEAELFEDNIGYFVKCTKCRCRTMIKESEQYAVKFWNIRKPMDKIIECLKEKGICENI